MRRRFNHFVTNRAVFLNKKRIESKLQEIFFFIHLKASIKIV